MSELHELYESHLQEVVILKSINKTRLKVQLLSYFHGQCQEESDGKSTVLAFKEGIEKLVKDSLDSRNFESEALLISKVAKIIRNEIFQWKNFHFSGKFPTNCQNDAVPTLLKSLVSMLLNGHNIKHEDPVESQACLTISQLIYFHVKNRHSEASKLRHVKDREPPLPIYVGLQVHSLTRSKKLVNSLSTVGVSVNYKHVIELENLLAGAVSTHFEKEGIVCPPNLRKGLFTVGAFDNFDHNPSSISAQGSFHGTGMSVFQFPIASDCGFQREPIIIDAFTGKCSLPDKYTTVPAVACQTDTLNVPEAGVGELFKGHLDNARKEHSMHLLMKSSLEKVDYISWAAFHASFQSNPVDPSAVIALLPLFYEKAATLAMVKHGMDIQKRITDYLNPDQIPVITFDQPLFALGKFVQWKWPESYGEKKFVVMFGGLHVEMALWNTIGDLLECSGWTDALIDAGVSSSGTADSFLKASHLTKTRRAHQVTLLALCRLQHSAWQKFISSVSESDELSFETWQKRMILNCPTFLYWNIVMEFEMMVLIFVRAHRTRNFDLYVEALEELLPWFFALDHINYARWLPIHIRDMRSIPGTILEEFRRCWVLQKSRNVFSCMPLDQAHEQNNDLLKGSGGIIGLTENPASLRRWIVAGPEQARLLKEFESQLSPDTGESHWQHHEQFLSVQESFKKNVQDLCDTISNMGNPFLDDCPELLVLHTHNCADEAVTDTIQNIKELGLSQYKDYVEDVINSRRVSIHQSIKKNSLPLFKRPLSKRNTKTRQQISSLRSDCTLFSHLYIASKFRDGDLEVFFPHENHPWPPSLADQ